MRACHCTNQCPACGQCCRVDCGHRRGGQTYVTGAATPAPVRPLREEDVRRIIREELQRMRGGS